MSLVTGGAASSPVTGMAVPSLVTGVDVPLAWDVLGYGFLDGAAYVNKGSP